MAMYTNQVSISCIKADPVLSELYVYFYQVNVVFRNNKAVVGSVIFIYRLDTCSWYSAKSPFFNETYIRDWPIWIFE